VSPTRHLRRRTAHASGDQRGTALIEVTWLSILLMVPLLYIVLAVFEVQRAAFAISAATRAAGRAYVLAPDEASARQRAEAAAGVALADQHLSIADGTLLVSCSPDPGDCLSPGAVVDVRISYRVALPLMPSALGGNTPSIRVEAQHRVPYGTFREDR
jgi:Flp pilus assembly protein TadG